MSTEKTQDYSLKNQLENVRARFIYKETNAGYQRFVERRVSLSLKNTTKKM